MARKFVLLALGTLALLLIAPTASAASVSLTIVAKENCADSSFCFEVTQGDAASVSPGDEVTVTFQNDGSSAHNLYVAAQDDADVGGDTPESAAIQNTDEVPSGNSTTVTFTAPSDASGVYYWCDVAGHEQLGMYLNQGYAGGNGGDGGDSPMPAWTMLVAFAAVGLALARRRRD